MKHSREAAVAVELLSSLETGQAATAALGLLPAVLDEAAPIPARHRRALGTDIRRLWEHLTSDRESRTADYLGMSAAHSAYLRYFLPWNILRIHAALSSLPALNLADGDSLLDMGSGPLTLPIALYLARPELRAKALTIHCADRTDRILESGKLVFETLCARLDGTLPPWKIELHRHRFGNPFGHKVKLFTAANAFNEFFWNDRDSLADRADRTALRILEYLEPSGSVFIMEPGDPRSGSFISAIRASLDRRGFVPRAPCPHAGFCPMPGHFRDPDLTDPRQSPGLSLMPGVRNASIPRMPKFRGKYPWCHFTLAADAAPAWLDALSKEAGLPKEKLVFSYLYAAREQAAHSGEPEPGLLTRVISEEFVLPAGSGDPRLSARGRYACSAEGYSLLRYLPEDGPFQSGDLLRLPSRPPAQNREIDEKSGAIVLP